MRKFHLLRLFILFSIVVAVQHGYAQEMAVDGKFGVSIFSGGGSTAFLLGGAVDIPTRQNFFVRPELNITTHGGTPIELAAVVKYDIPSIKSPSKVYVDGGLGLWFFSGGPYFGLDFGGGTIFPLDVSKISIPAEIRLGPIFSSGSTTFQIGISGGVRFSIH